MTKLTKFLQYLRNKNGENKKQMAKRLKVAESFLSNVEHERKNVPIVWIDVISETYNLDDRERKALQDIIVNTIIDKRKIDKVVKEVIR